MLVLFSESLAPVVPETNSTLFEYVSSLYLVESIQSSILYSDNLLHHHVDYSKYFHIPQQAK